MEGIKVASQIASLTDSLEILERMKRQIKQGEEQDVQADFKLYMRTRQDSNRLAISS